MRSSVRRSGALALALLAVASLTAAMGSVALAQAPVREIKVEGGDYYFKPKDITVAAGERVRIVFTNVGPIAHELEISRLGAKDVKWSVAAGVSVPADEKKDVDEHAARGTPEVWLPRRSSGTVEFTPVNPGTYKLECGIEGHEEAGMVGTFTVLAAGQQPTQLPRAGGLPLAPLAAGAAGLGMVLALGGLALLRRR
ncbi:MAG: cupredoxin domain-containing protein [Chloroflexi bacterium]|nr:cupredoxin domain-containing protein [Chloroflexota bacterium]MBI4503929.1 cupredoxin domain-containing protein [Chloroflexota bacterium]